MAVFEVPRCQPMDHFLYLSTPSTTCEQLNTAEMPALMEGSVRIVCISDTHNEHDALRLPPGDVLIHSGDVLTESGTRHVMRGRGNRQGDSRSLTAHLHRCD